MRPRTLIDQEMRDSKIQQRRAGATDIKIIGTVDHGEKYFSPAEEILVKNIKI